MHVPICSWAFFVCIDVCICLVLSLFSVHICVCALMHCAPVIFGACVCAHICALFCCNLNLLLQNEHDFYTRVCVLSSSVIHVALFVYDWGVFAVVICVLLIFCDVLQEFCALVSPWCFDASLCVLTSACMCVMCVICLWYCSCVRMWSCAWIHVCFCACVLVLFSVCDFFIIYSLRACNCAYVYSLLFSSFCVVTCSWCACMTLCVLNMCMYMFVCIWACLHTNCLQE